MTVHSSAFFQSGARISRLVQMRVLCVVAGAGGVATEVGDTRFEVAADGKIVGVGGLGGQR